MQNAPGRSWIELRPPDPESGHYLFVRAEEPVSQAESEQLREWAAATDTPNTSERDLLAAITTFDGLAVAAATGVIGNAAWELFPAAGRWLRDAVRRERPSVTADEIVTVARECVNHVAGDDALVTLDAVEKVVAGSTAEWEVQARSGGRTYELVLSLSGDVVNVRLTGNAGQPG